MKVRVLGCGTSTGVPRVGANGWGECDPAEPRNRRTRSSILIESGGERLLVDCGPDVREQLIAGAVDRIEGVIVTHDHADHCHGIDDLRPFAQLQQRPLAVLARPAVLDSLQCRFGYIFRSSQFYPAIAETRTIPDEMAFGELRLRFVDQPHGRTASLGMRLDQDGRSIVYAIDFNHMTDAMRELYEGADVWISDCLSRRPHPTHAHLDAVLGWARELRVGQLYLSHLSNAMDYATLVAELPSWAAPAHDGLEIRL